MTGIMTEYNNMLSIKKNSYLLNYSRIRIFELNTLIEIKYCIYLFLFSNLIIIVENNNN